MLNIALVSHSPHLAGAERMLTNFAVSLETRKKFHPIVLIPNPSIGAMPSILADRGVEWRQAPEIRWYGFEDTSGSAEYARHVSSASVGAVVD